MNVNGDSADRAERIEALNQAARAHSTATVMMHAVIHELHGLSATDGKTLDLLDRFGPLTATQLATQTGLAPASVTELIDRLEARGLVRRERDTADRRRVVVHTVPERVAELSPLFEVVAREAAKVWSEFTDAELDVIHRFMQRSVTFVRDVTAAIRGGAVDRGA